MFGDVGGVLKNVGGMLGDVGGMLGDVGGMFGDVFTSHHLCVSGNLPGLFMMTGRGRKNNGRGRKLVKLV